MSLTRFLPTPSDRMGILWSLLNVEGGAIVEYGPAGTTHFSMSLFGELGVEQENRLFTTHLREEDVVMGDTSRLENALVEVDENFHPAVIFVAASSCSAVIGTDLRGVCAAVQPRVRARLVALEQGGFQSDYSAGIREAYLLLADRLVRPERRESGNRFNILGASIGAYRCKADAIEISRLMEEAFGMKVNACLCLDTDLEKIASMGGARLNLVIRQEALPAARLLEKKCGTPFVYGAPYGYQGTLDWLEAVGGRLGSPVSSSLAGALRRRAMETAQYRMYGRMLRRDRPQAALYGEYEAVRGLGAFLAGMGVSPVHRLSAHALSSLEAPEEGIVHLSAEKERIDLMRSLRHTLVLADDTSRRLLDGTNTFIRVATPLIDKAQVAVHMPVMGPRGADMLMETVDAYFNTLK